MGAIGADGFTVSWPATPDTALTEVDAPSGSKTRVRAAVPNAQNAVLLALETELGTDPAGSLSDVKTFLQLEHNANGTHKIASFIFPAGTVTTFYQAAAPTGWTRVTTQNDKALRVVSAGSPGTAGGTTAFSGLGGAGGNASGDHTHTGPSHTHTGPSHTHSLTNGSTSSLFDGSIPTSSAVGLGDTNFLATKPSVGSNNTWQSKTDTTNAQGTGATGSNGTGVTAGQSATHTHTGLLPQFIDVLLASRD